MERIARTSKWTEMECKEHRNRTYRTPKWIEMERIEHQNGTYRTPKCQTAGPGEVFSKKSSILPIVRSKIHVNIGEIRDCSHRKC